MKTYEFTVIASGLDPAAHDFEDRFLSDADGGDATLKFVNGRIVIGFQRRARNYGEAVASAIRDVMRAGAVVEHIEPDRMSRPRPSAGFSDQGDDVLLRGHTAASVLDANLTKEVEDVLAMDRDLARSLEQVRQKITEAILLNAGPEASGARTADGASAVTDQQGRRLARQSNWSRLRAWLSRAFTSRPSLRPIADSAASIAHFAASNEAVEYPFKSDLDAMADDWMRVGRRLRRQTNVEALIQASE